MQKGFFALSTEFPQFTDQQQIEVSLRAVDKCAVDSGNYGDNSMDLQRLQSVIRAGLAQGARLVSPTRARWDVSGDCHSPRSVFLAARPPSEVVETLPLFGERKIRRMERGIVVKPGSAVPLELELEARCNRCDACMKFRMRRIRRRIIAECKLAELRGCRVWFGTLTCSPDYLYRKRCVASIDAASTAVEFDAEEEKSRFEKLDRVIYRDIKLMWKRLRKGSEGCPAAAFRYLVVTERHKSGAPHYHVLLFETDSMRPVRKRVIRSAHWTGGFTAWKLVTGAHVGIYVAKYVGKDNIKSRCSVQFGRTEAELASWLVERMRPIPAALEQRTST